MYTRIKIKRLIFLRILLGSFVLAGAFFLLLSLYIDGV
ncbi:hypothetical protein GPUN_1768 [Glaciecola punicea ACAM 611]|uniref:Uncharacterized protein n=1 Tax=Glaciecola punicea ACAM 611 TaxID=1121923 RepID=H5TC57_9ALTE|nr:hypothetical protein GPUN_1768 [Glaciecola punicea ACAM 611]